MCYQTMKENRLIDRYCRLSYFFRRLDLYWDYFKERQSFFFFFFSSFFSTIYTHYNWTTHFVSTMKYSQKKSTSCFNDLARSIRCFVVATSHRELTYIHILLEKYERRNWPSTTRYRHSVLNLFKSWPSLP